MAFVCRISKRGPFGLVGNQCSDLLRCPSAVLLAAKATHRLCFVPIKAGDCGTFSGEFFFFLLGLAWRLYCHWEVMGSRARSSR